MCTHRRVTPALGARLLRSYVPLRYGPSESGCASNTCLPADTLSVRKNRNFCIFLQRTLLKPVISANILMQITRAGSLSPGLPQRGGMSGTSRFFLVYRLEIGADLVKRRQIIWNGKEENDA